MSLPKETREILVALAPELAENDDERIRKFLIDMVKRETGFAGFPSQGQVLAYLEKQKEKEPVPISCSHENGTPAERKAIINGEPIQTKNQSIDIPLVEWSDEDEKMFKESLTDIIYAKNEFNKKGCEGLAKSALDTFNWLNMRIKSLRPSWKPSEEDIKMLEHIIGQYEIGNKNSKVMGYLPRIEELNFLKKVLTKWKNLL